MDIYMKSLHSRDNFQTLKVQHSTAWPGPGGFVRGGFISEEAQERLAKGDKDREQTIIELKQRLAREQEARVKEQEALVKQQEELKVGQEALKKEWEAIREKQEELDMHETEKLEAQAELCRAVKIQEFETQLVGMLTTTDSCQEATAGLADLYHLPDFPLLDDGTSAGQATVSVPGHFLANLEKAVNDSSRVRFLAMKDAILSRVVGRAKAALEVGIEDQETERQGRTKRKSEGGQEESSRSRSRLETFNRTPSPSSVPPPHPIIRKPQHPPHPTPKVLPKAKEQEKKLAHVIDTSF